MVALGLRRPAMQNGKLGASPVFRGRRLSDWRGLETFSFGDTPELAEKLARLVVEGKKTATCWAASEGPKTQVGQRWVMLDGAGRPRAVTETVELVQRRFDEVEESLAFEEGEGDRTLAFWRAAYRSYFGRRGQFSDNMLLWCERFRVVERLDIQPGPALP
jgi:uncharacterized protein YhfF